MFGDLDYSGLGAPGLDSLAQFSTPSYIDAAPHRIALQYGAPGIYDGGIARSKFHYGPPHRIAMCYGGDAMPVGVPLSAGDGEIYTLRSDGGYELKNTKKNFTALISKNDIDWQPTNEYVQAQWAAGKLKPVSGSGEKKTGLLDKFLSFFTSENAAKVSAATSAFKSGGTPAGKVVEEESFWDKYGTAIMIGGGLVATAGVIYAVTRPSADDQNDRLYRANRSKPKAKGKKSKKSAKRKTSRKSGRR